MVYSPLWGLLAAAGQPRLRSRATVIHLQDGRSPHLPPPISMGMPTCGMCDASQAGLHLLCPDVCTVNAIG